MAINVYKLQNKDKATFYSLPMHGQCRENSWLAHSDELETLGKYRKPTTVITANEEVQTSEDAQVYVHDLELFVRCKSSMTRLQSCRCENSAKNTDIPMSGPVVKSHI